jgi:hypothetical protein
MNVSRPTRRRYLAAMTLLLAGMLSPISARAQTQKGAAESLAARVQRLEDVEAITNVLITYGRSLDARDLDTYSKLFARDGEWSGGFGTVKGGPPAVLAFMQKSLGTGGGRAGSTYHIMSNFQIDVKGDTATAWSHWTFISAGAENKPAIAQGGRYEDTLVREDGHWKFQRRLATRDVPRRDVPAPAAAK